MLGQKDKLLLRELQFDFPLLERPFLEIAKRLGLTEQQVIKKVRFFCDTGIIRYIAGIFDQGKLGIVSTLIALSVPNKDLARVSRIINAYPQVTHNYLRRDVSLAFAQRGKKFNLWFTLSASSEVKLLSLIKEIRRKTGVEDMLNLPTKKVFKIDARFMM